MMEKLSRTQKAVLITAGVMTPLLGAYVAETISNGDETVRYQHQTECVFTDETKPVERAPEEGLGSIAVRSIPGVNWGQCNNEAVAWIEQHNPDMQNAPGETINVPISVEVK